MGLFLLLFGSIISSIAN